MSKTSEELYLTSKFTGWTDYSTIRGIDTTDQLINDAATILNYIETSGRFKRFYDTMQGYLSHINQEDRSPHSVTLEQVVNTIAHLYQQYRDRGYTGSTEDMLHALLNKIDKVTYAEAIEGTDDTKAVGAVKFANRFIIHDRAIKAHQDLFRTFMSTTVSKLHSTLSFINQYSEQYDRYYDDDTTTYTYDLLNKNRWNNDAGAIHLTISCDVRVDRVDIFSIHTSTSIYTCYTENGNIGISQNTTTICEVPLELVTPDKRSIIFSYSRNNVLLKAIGQPTKHVDGIYDLAATHLVFHLPFYKDIPFAEPSMVRLVYYPMYISDDTQLAALLS